jgi:hypothetical protein
MLDESNDMERGRDDIQCFLPNYNYQRGIQVNEVKVNG